MLANAAGIMPDSLKFEADQLFFERRLDGVDVVVHGRHSHYEIALDNNPGTPRFHGTCNALVDVAPFFDGSLLLPPALSAIAHASSRAHPGWPRTPLAGSPSD